MSEQCQKCGAAFVGEGCMGGKEWECGYFETAHPLRVFQGDKCKIKSLERENATLREQLAAAMTMEQVCDILGRHATVETEWLELAADLGIYYDYGTGKFKPRKAVSGE